MTLDDFGITLAAGEFIQGIEGLEPLGGQNALGRPDAEIHAVEGKILLNRFFGIGGIGCRRYGCEVGGLLQLPFLQCQVTVIDTERQYADEERCGEPRRDGDVARSIPKEAGEKGVDISHVMLLRSGWWKNAG